MQSNGLQKCFRSATADRVERKPLVYILLFQAALAQCQLHNILRLGRFQVAAFCTYVYNMTAFNFAKSKCPHELRFRIS